MFDKTKLAVHQMVSYENIMSQPHIYPKKCQQNCLENTFKNVSLVKLQSVFFSEPHYNCSKNNKKMPECKYLRKRDLSKLKLQTEDI